MNARERRKQDGAPLTDKVLTAIAKHLNKDHREDLLACAKVAGSPEIEDVKVTQLDANGISLEVSDSNNKVSSLRLDFPTTAGGVLAFKRLLGAKMTESRAQLGWTPLNPTEGG